MILTVTEQAITALNTTAGQLRDVEKKISNESTVLKACFDEQIDGLGPHAESIRALVEEVEALQRNASGSVNKLVLKLQKAVRIRKNILEKNRYDSKGTHSTVSAQGGASGKNGSVSTDSRKTTGPAKLSTPAQVSERTLFELDVLEADLKLTDGDSSIMQVGGYDSEVTKVTKGSGFESHHIPPQSIFTDQRGNLPTIAITKEDHKKTSSFSGRMGHRYEPIIPGGNTDHPKHKQSITDSVDQGFLAEMIRNEIYEIREAFGSKYDGAIKQYLDAMRDYIKKNGVPKTGARMRKSDVDVTHR